jgi:hypothetical protein
VVPSGIYFYLQAFQLFRIKLNLFDLFTVYSNYLVVICIHGHMNTVESIYYHGGGLTAAGVGLTATGGGFNATPGGFTVESINYQRGFQRRARSDLPLQPILQIV